MRFIVYLFLVSLVVPIFQVRSADAITSSTLIINQIRTDGSNKAGAAPKEYIELFNATKSAINLKGWRVDYANLKATLTAKTCTAASWVTAGGKANVKEIALSGQIPANGTVLVPVPIMLDDQAGAVRLVKTGATPVIHDMVGWDTDVAPAVCAEAKQTVIPRGGQRVTRCVDEVKVLPQDTNNNARDFFLLGDKDLTPPVCPVPPPAPPTKPTPDTPAPDTSSACEDIELSEIVANPEGEDTDREYIELYNPAEEARSLKGCGLRVGTSTAQYLLPDDAILQADERKAFYSLQTDLQLTNTGGQVWLMTPTDETIVEYPALGDDEAWAFIDTEWKLTTTATPDKTNVLPKEDDGNGEAKPSLGPCPAGKYRNPATNRCRSIAAVARYAPCRIGQVRSPETNRCRNLVMRSAELAPCQAGQQRNPATNRCRNVLAATNSLKPCAADQERNPVTNRCRKVVRLASANTTGTDSSIAPEKQKVSRLSYAVAAGLVAAVGGYGAYEYRHDIRNKLSGIRTKTAGKTSK